jgi:DtxR family Mn-dependent transcriptional regulator
MSVSELSTSSQNYLKAIWSLQEWSEDPVTASALSAKAGVRMSTASDAIRKLADQGLVEHAPYGAVTLTARGRAHAVAMVRRHRLIETFLVQQLGYGWDQVHDEADHLEHAVSDFLVERIDETLGRPERDPHGDPIPRPDGSVSRPDAVVLSAVVPGTSVRVERISDADPDLLRHFSDAGIAVGTILQVQPGPPFSGSVEVSVAGSSPALPLGRVATDSVWVTPLT